MFFTGAGAGFRQNSEYWGRASAGFSIFLNTVAGSRPGLTKFTCIGAGARFVEKYRDLTGAGAGAGAGAPFGSKFYEQKCCSFFKEGSLL